jgi:Asp-tRNA(Asn)/Glu-tRNA(Gln) amidotransferase A subunit family amidase
MATSFATAAACFKSAGAEIQEVHLPPLFERLLSAQTIIMAYEGAQALAYERLHHGENVSAKLRKLLDDGMAIDASAYDHARAIAATCRRCLEEVFGRCDVLLAPSAPGEAPLAETGTGDPIFNRTWTLLGTPCVNVPGLAAPSGLPLGVQAIGRPFDDARTLYAAAWMQMRLA